MSKRGSVGEAGQKWCSLHNSITHNDVDCDKQKTTSPQKGGAYSADTAGTNSITDLDKGFSWMATGVRSFQANKDTMTMLVDSGATKHLLDYELIPGLKNVLLDYKLLGPSKKITAPDQQVLLGGSRQCSTRHYHRRERRDAQI